jgi:hemerythrin-like metal-binding protein
MALITWSSKYSVGVEALDNQHKALINLLNEFHAASMRGEAKKVAGPLISKMVSLAKEHFSNEERMMESTKYPGLAEHRAIHQELTGKVGEFVSRHEKGDTTMYASLLYFMRDWLNNHMQTEDHKYAPWLKEHGVR